MIWCRSRSGRSPGALPSASSPGRLAPAPHVVAVAAALWLASIGSSARAVEPIGEGFPLSFEAHGFVSQGFIKTTANNYLASSHRGSFELSEVGINFTSQVTEKLRVGMQLFARDLGPLGNYSAKMDWFYLDYRLRDWLGFRAGRVKLPFGLYNEVSDIDSARVPILLPQSVYPLVERDFLLAQTGMELYGYLNLNRGGALDYRAYVGTIYIDLSNRIGAPVQVSQLQNPYIVGGRLLWETPLDGLRLGGSLQALRLDFDLSIPATSAVGFYRISAVLWLLSLEYARHDWLLSAEYGRWHLSNQSDQAALLQPDRVAEQGYVMASTRVRSWLQPGVYYSVLFPDVARASLASSVRGDHAGSRADMQHDVAATLRFDINSHWIIKLEGHYMHGTAGLQEQLNDNAALGTLTKDWGVALVKTTAFF